MSVGISRPFPSSRLEHVSGSFFMLLRNFCFSLLSSLRFHNLSTVKAKRTPKKGLLQKLKEAFSSNHEEEEDTWEQQDDELTEESDMMFGDDEEFVPM